jgi:hypothetical protein
LDTASHPQPRCARETIDLGEPHAKEIRSMRAAGESMSVQLPEVVQDLRDAGTQWRLSGTLFIGGRDVELGENPPPNLVSAHVADRAVGVGSSEMQALTRALHSTEIRACRD